MSADPLSVSLDLSATAPPSGEVVLSNEGADAIRIWREGNGWGDVALSFVLSRADREATITRRPQTYTRNVPAPVQLPAGGSRRVAFDLGDGTWEPDGALAGLPDPGATLTAVYEIRLTPESDQHDVWTGRARSEAVAIG